MNILQFHQNLIDSYKRYIQSFIQIKDPRIRDFVDQELNGKKLWPEPLVQFNPTFERSKPIEQLVAEGLLHHEFKRIYAGLGSFYRHQEEAIRLGVAGREFIVTSGTGSGKSLTYLTTIFNHILTQGSNVAHKIVAVVVYPMNALINSQYKEIEKFKKAYEEQYRRPFPVTFAPYTGQETEEQRDSLKAQPPHILLTNYVMLELAMTRSGRDEAIRDNFLKNIRFLVFDELHTYRGRQGSDVAMLIRRLKAAAHHPVQCMGTSATMVSDDVSGLDEQKKKVAEVASTIFGSAIGPEQVVYEYLQRGLVPELHPGANEVREAVEAGIDPDGPEDAFLQHPTAHWVEEQVALEFRDGMWVRRKPAGLSAMAGQLAEFTGLSLDKTRLHLEQLLEWANRLNHKPERKQNYLPFRIHQFIAQTGSVYSTLGDQTSRQLFLDAGLYAGSKDIMLYPLVFSRSTGHEFYCVRLDTNNGIILPREFHDYGEDEEDSNQWEGYIFIQHKEDDGPIWDLERDAAELPDSWFNFSRRNGRRLKKEREKRLPRPISFKKTGEFSFEQDLDHRGWFIPSPLLLDPTSGTLFDARTAEWTKLMKLGGEGRSTATTVLSFETIAQLHALDEPPEKQKLLSFTDNRQDASLQAGHFNDFVNVGHLRAAIVRALKKHSPLDYTNIADRVFESLNLTQEQYATHPGDFPGAQKDNEEALKLFIMYRLLQDLKTSWRVVMPNLEQCALLSIKYRHLEETVDNDELWQPNALLSAMPAQRRLEFLMQIFDFFRKSYALSFNMLDEGRIDGNSRIIKNKLKPPYTLDENENLETPTYIRVERLAAGRRSIFTESASYTSVMGRYIRSVAREFGMHEEVSGQEAYRVFVHQLFGFLVEGGGWLSRSEAIAEDGQATSVYRLNVDTLLWCRGDGKTVAPDLVRARSYRRQIIKPNIYFQEFYKTDFSRIKSIEGREHTGQINTEERKKREEKFRSGEIAALFCSPTMELGIDISDLSVVHMRNVPPSPANYAQRSGRAGRSGQAALVLVYCSNYSPHDRHYFKHMEQMVAGSVSAPRMDLLNEELLLSHLNASILALCPLGALEKSLGDLVITQMLDSLPLRDEVAESLQLSKDKKDFVLNFYKRVVGDLYFERELVLRKPSWFTDAWIRRHIDAFPQAFDRALDRWRKLYRAAAQQIYEATSIINNRIYEQNNAKRDEAYRILRLAERQRDLLLNSFPGASEMASQSEFYPYRYLAAEGFLPGYNFTRLPVRAFVTGYKDGGEYISRPRFIALSEFGPKNIIYHDGAKYSIDQMIFPEAELHLEKAKICPKTGYFLIGSQYGYEMDPIINEEINPDPSQHLHYNLLELAESRAREVQRITCQEEERIRKGYDIQTYFAVDGGFEQTTEGIVSVEGEPLLHIHYMPACRIYKLNLRWISAQEDGFAVHLKTGFWLNQRQREESLASEQNDAIRQVKLFTSGTANALYMQPIKALGLKGGRNGVITLMYAIKRAIENYFQVEANEIGVTIMGQPDAPNILIYEAAEGSLGVLAQIVDDPTVYSSIMQEAYQICFFKDGKELETDDSGQYVPATYDDLLSYYNQFYHQQIDKNLIKESLEKLRHAEVEILSGHVFGSYEEQYAYLQKHRDPASETEDRFLKFLYQRGLRLPDEAQPRVKDFYVRPDFYYKPNIYIFCDGTPHDSPEVRKSDLEKREALRNAGFQVLSWYYRDALEDLVAQRPDIFKKVKEK